MARSRPKADARLVGKNTRGCGKVIGYVPKAAKGTFRRYVTADGAVIEIKKMSKAAMKKGAWKKCAIRRRRWIKRNGKTIAVWDAKDTKKTRKARTAPAAKAQTSTKRGAKRGGKRSAKPREKKTSSGGTATTKRRAKRGAKKGAKKGASRKTRATAAATIAKTNGRYVSKVACRNAVKNAITLTQRMMDPTPTVAQKAKVKKLKKNAANIPTASHAPVRIHGGDGTNFSLTSAGPSTNPRTPSQLKADAQRSKAQKKAVKEMKRDSKGQIVGKA